MINYLKYKVKFTSTGKTFANEIKFQPGLTIISGKNEKGKSLILELIEYAWFGASALRGQLSDYDILEVTSEATIKDKNHKVVRNGTSHKLDGITTGASAVNKEIVDLLGFNLDVFRIACSAKQGELDRLTARMKPTERKKMIDELVGLDQLEEVEKLCKSEVSGLKKLRDSLSNRLVKPEEVIKPEIYLSPDHLNEILRSKLLVEQLSSIPKPALPPEPEPVGFSEDVENYEQQRLATNSQREGIERLIRTIPAASYPRQTTQCAIEYYNQANRGPYPSLDRGAIEESFRTWNLLEKFNHSIQCPNCKVTFLPNQYEILDEAPVEPAFTRKELDVQLAQWGKWEGVEYKELPVPDMTHSQAEANLLALDKADMRLELEKQVADLPVLESKAHELKAKQEYEAQVRDYNLQLKRYVDDLCNFADGQAMLESIHLPEYDLDEAIKNSRIYEEQLAVYTVLIDSYTSGIVELESLNAQIEEYNAGAECLKFVRSQIKQHLVPSLNAVASHLLSEMTNGSRQSIIVNEDFDVTVDGQPVRTLSGSGVSVVNLALRIALGQVLTQKVVPLFMADEIDADCDEERTEAIYAAIRNLTKSVNKIIIVSHKPVEGDHLIGV